MLDEILLMTGVLLMAVGCLFLWWPLALMVIGISLIWISLPPRLPFITRSVEDRSRPRRRSVS